VKKGWRKIVSLALALLVISSMASVSSAYPNQGQPNTVLPPASRSYFPTDISQLPSSKGLNDPFLFLNPELGTNGKVVTAADWQARRDEIKDILQYYYFGYKWPTAKSDVMVDGYFAYDSAKRTYSIPSDNPVLDNGCMIIRVNNPDNGKTATFQVTGIYIPVYRDVPYDQLGTNETNIPGPYPVVLGVATNFERTQTLKHGYAIMNLSTGSVYSDNVNRTGAYTTLYPFDGTKYEYDSGALMGWAWGISRILDALENGAYAGKIDPTRSVVTGFSRNGKAALLAGAFDDRISFVAPGDQGQSGSSSFRYTDEAQLFNYKVPNGMERVYARNEKPTNVLSDSEAHWLNWKAEDFRYSTDRLPFDSNLIEALCAPRPQITCTGEEYDWLGSPGTCLTMEAAKEVYDFLGSGDKIAVRVHDGMHAIQSRDVGYYLAVMDQLFHRNGQGQYVVENLYTTNPPSYGAGTYNKISDMTAYPYELDSSYIQWARPGKYVLWSDIQAVTEGIPATITAHSDAAAVMMTAPSGAVYTVETVNGVAVFKLTASQVEEGRYSLDTVGTDKDSNTVYFQGMYLPDALRHGITVNNTGGAGSPPVYGFTSKINKDTIQLFRDGVQIPATVNEGAKMDDGAGNMVAIPGYIMSYGARLDNSPAYNVATLKHLQLESMPGYTFEVSFDRNVFMSFPAGSSAAGSREKPSWASADTAVGPQPEWPPFPNTTTDTGDRSVPAKTTTNFRTAITCSLSGNEVDKDVNEFTLNFSTPVNKNELGIGFDFTDDWTLNWAEDNKSVTVKFDNSKLDWGKTCNIIIFRLRDMDKNMIGTPDPNNSDVWYAGPVTRSFSIYPVEPLNITTTANLVQKGDYFDVAASFIQATTANAVSFVLTYDKDKFEYAGNLGGDPSQETYIDGLTYLTSEAGDGNVKLTMMIPDYKAQNLISLRFRAKENADIQNADNSITATANFVYKDSAGNKIVRPAYGTTEFTTSGNPGDTDTDGKVTLLDLSNVIDMFGVKSGDALWTKARFFDFNKNKIIDIADIVAVAKKIF